MSGFLWLYKCVHCHLVFADEPEEQKCPYCQGYIVEIGKVQMASDDGGKEGVGVRVEIE